MRDDLTDPYEVWREQLLDLPAAMGLDVPRSLATPRQLDSFTLTARSPSRTAASVQDLIRTSDVALRRALAIAQGHKPVQVPDGLRLPMVGDSSLLVEDFWVGSGNIRFSAAYRAIERWGSRSPVALVILAAVLSGACELPVDVRVGRGDQLSQQIPLDDIQEGMHGCGITVSSDVLEPGTSLEIEARSSDGDWCRVEIERPDKG